MSDQLSVKQILLQVLAEIEDLSTDRAVLFAALQPPLKMGDAYAAKSKIAIETTKKYAKLRKQIEEIAI
jgi:hypothetical protein